MTMPVVQTTNQNARASTAPLTAICLAGVSTIACISPPERTYTWRSGNSASRKRRSRLSWSRTIRAGTSCRASARYAPETRGEATSGAPKTSGANGHTGRDRSSRAVQLGPRAARFRQHVAYELALPVGVGAAVVPMLRGKRALEPAIGAGRGRVRQQMVAEGHVLGVRSASRQAHIQVMV